MIRSIATVMRGTVIAQVIGFAALPILTRLYGPKPFGSFQLYISIVTLLLVFTTLRYEVALLRARSPRELRALAQLCAVACVFVSLVVALIGYILVAIGWPSQLVALPFSIWLLVAATLFGGFAQFLTVLVTRQQAFSVSANSKIIQSTSYVGTAIGIGAVKPVSGGLAIGDVAGRFFNAVYVASWTRRNMAGIWRPSSLSSLIAVARRYREYPLISVPGTAVNVIGGIMTPIMIYTTFSPAISGQYGLFERSATLPVALIANSAAQVFTAQFSAELRSGAEGALAYFRQVVFYMTLLALAFVAGTILLAPMVFSLLFGEQWRLAGELAQIMAPALATTLLSGPVNMVLTVMGHQKLQTAWEISRLVLVCGLWLVVPYASLPLKTAVGGYSAILVVCNLAFVGLAYVMLKSRITNLERAPSPL